MTTWIYFRKCYCIAAIPLVGVLASPNQMRLTVNRNDCIPCRPDGDVIWYETEEIEDPVLPFCSMLYQLAGKCNVELEPSGRYDPSALYALEDNRFFLNDVCSTVQRMDGEMAAKQSLLKKWSDDMRIARKAMPPAAKAGFVVSTLFLAALTVAACIYANMPDFEVRARKLRPEEIQEIPDFNYRPQEELHRKDSGVERARSTRRQAPSPLTRMSRSRTVQDF